MTTHEDFSTPLRRFFKLLKPDNKDILYLYSYGAFIGLINLSLPLGFQSIINQIMGGQLSTSWTILVIFVIGGLLMSGGLLVYQLSITERLQQRIFTRSSFEFAFHLPRIKLELVYNKSVPELVNRFFDTFAVQKGLAKILIDFSTATLQILFGLVLLSFYHEFFIFYGIIIILLVYLIFRLTAPQGLSTSLKESRYKYAVAHWLEEVGRSLETFKLAGKTDLPLSKTDELVSGYIDARKKHFMVLKVQYMSLVGFKVVTAGGLLIMGSMLLINQQINLGQFVAAEIVILLVMTSVEKLILSMETIYDVLTALEKIAVVTDLPLERKDGINFEETDTHRGMVLNVKNLHFKHPGMQEDIIKNISFHVGEGQRICLSGLSGSGKSTLLQLLAGLYQEFRGTISYNNIPVGNLNLTSLRSYIGDSLNEEKLFMGTLFDNISLGREGVTMKKVIEAAEVVCLTGFVQNLKDGFNAVIDPEGKNIPSSEIAKIMIARSIACSSRLLLLGDQLNTLDPLEREKILQFLMDKKNNWTLMVISNQASIAKRCDRVIVLQQGKVLSDAPFHLLPENNMFYKAN